MICRFSMNQQPIGEPGRKHAGMARWVFRGLGHSLKGVWRSGFYEETRASRRSGYEFGMDKIEAIRY